MNTGHFISSVDKLWTQVMMNVRDAVVFMDDPSAECLHWNGGLKRILDSGAVSVENFSPFVKYDAKIKKAVFVLMSPLSGETWKTIAIVTQANDFKTCIILSALPPKCHSDEPEISNRIFPTLEAQLKDWLQDQSFSVSMKHLPLFPAYISQNFFLMPAFSKLFSVFKCCSTEMNLKKTDDLSIRSVSSEMQSSIKRIAYSLTSLFCNFQVNGDFFSLGPLSHILCTELEKFPQLKNFHEKASVVVVDRLLDLAGPLSQSYETMLDKILLSFNHLHGHIFDVAVPMNELAACKNASVFGRPLLAPGCLAHKDSSYEDIVLNAILTKKPREVLSEANRCIAECASRAGIRLDLAARLTPNILKQRVLDFKSEPRSILNYSGLFQQVLAVIQALENCSTNSVESLSALEKALLEYLTTSPEEVLSYIMQMISEKEEMNYKMEEILIFLAFFYMLSGETDIPNESAMQATLMEEFFQDKSANDLLSLFVDEEHLEEDEHVLNSVRTLFDVFRRIGVLRKKLKRYPTLFESTNPAFPASYNALLKQILNDILDPAISENPDIEYHSAGFRDYLKNSFSLFLNVGKPQPRHNNIIFLIVLGGVTPSEIKLVHETASQKGVKIILGSTDVLTPKSVLKDLGLVVKELVKQEYEDDML